MNKQEFLEKLRIDLSGIPEEEIEERVTFYSEMIDDKIEEGLTEEEAISSIGPIDSIVKQTVHDVPLTKIVMDKVLPKKGMSKGALILIILGAPIWISILTGIASVVVSVYVTIWAGLIALWAIFGAFVGVGFACPLTGITLAARGQILEGIALIGAGLIFLGLSIYAYLVCKLLTKLVIMLTKKVISIIKFSLMKGRANNE